MIEAVSWMQAATERLKQHFGERLLFVGLQGSHRRNEAREDSDIDILTVLDVLNVSDLAEYRRILDSLPEGEKAHGFTCGHRELLAWPRYELFQLCQETDNYHGNLKALMPDFDGQDIEAGTRIGAANLYHATAHIYIASDSASRCDELKPVFKAFFFAMQMVYYMRHNTYIRNKRDLLPLLTGDEYTMLRLGMDEALFEELRKNEPDNLFQLLLQWCSQVLQEDFGKHYTI